MSVILESSFNVEDFSKPSKFPVCRTELKPEEVLVKLKKLQQAHKDLEDEVKETILLRNIMQQEDDILNAEALQLEGTLNEKEELNRSLQLKCEDLKQETQRQLEQNHQKDELVKQYCFQIQETKLKHRKLRMMFENQLQQLMEQHKNLSTVFTPQTLPAEIQSAEYATEQLLKAEQQKHEQLAELQDRLNHYQTSKMQMDTCDKTT
ncbi:synaptonemal complex central element protein 1 isoform X1 [Misgurnus anguillicaudatus]|uniref:synaptonemal complex central element protein 1 isoform X1 n=1 Tax=Misgurnus anguillicaudatus TaxID=75329 RepID=UPI002434A340|nr:synaptonemal complex central element protein 1 isoform X1 [Misgurnus anguillicaudatus]XP_055076700.1 synaptonemal complex central element protein 1 isoform X1 [Misgurnus anguillicaudatus]